MEAGLHCRSCPVLSGCPGGGGTGSPTGMTAWLSSSCLPPPPLSPGSSPEPPHPPTPPTSLPSLFSGPGEGWMLPARWTALYKDGRRHHRGRSGPCTLKDFSYRFIDQVNTQVVVGLDPLPFFIPRMFTSTDWEC